MRDDELLTDPTVTWYGPHACDVCGVTIIKAERARGGAAFEPPTRLLRVFDRGAEAGDPQVAYPHAWVPHVHLRNLLPAEECPR